jgi:hypothetical protein
MENLFNPLEFGFRDLGRTQYGHTYRNEYVDIRRVDGYVKTRKRGFKYHSSLGDISPMDVWKIRFINENSYIYTGVIPNKDFAFELLKNLEALTDSVVSQLERDKIVNKKAILMALEKMLSL